MNILKHYSIFIEKRPLIGNMVTSAVLFGAGDVLAQSMSSHPYDFSRTFRNALYGGAVFAPIAGKLYPFLQHQIRWPWVWPRMMMITNRRKKSLDTLARVFVDQIGWAPIGIVLYLTWVNILEGHSWIETRKRVGDSWWGTLLANWAVWPAVQVINFAVVPVQFRVVVVGIVGVLWNGFLSWVAWESNQKTD
jgi:hypothetical protein